MTIEAEIKRYRNLANNERCCQKEECLILANWLEELLKYRKAEEQGLIPKLPCRVGDTVYLLWRGKIYERKVNGFFVTSNNRLVVHVPDCDMDNATLPIEQFGKILFLSRESALAEKGGV